MAGRSLGKAQETLGGAIRRSPNNSCQSLPKVEPLPGSLHAEWKTCGTSTCRCARGERHGPYWTHRWREGGRQRRRHVKPGDLEQVQDGLAEWRRLHPPVRSVRTALASLRWLQEHFPDDWRA